MSILEVNTSQPSGSSLVTRPKNASAVKKPKLVRATIKASPSKPVTRPKNASAVKKPKLVRDSFTFPKDEHQAIDTLKKKALNLKYSTKKSEILRAGLKLLSSLNDIAFLLALATVSALPTGKKKNKKRV